MILFKPAFVTPILSGDKDMTRRLTKPRVRVGAIHKAKTAMLSRESFARLEITGLRQERLSAITEEDARREGGYTRHEFLGVFRRIYGLALDADPEIWVVSFRLAEPTQDEDFEMLVQKNARLMEMLTK